MTIWSAVTAKDVLKADRLDADYYKPADLEILRLTRDLGGSALGSFCSIRNGKTPQEYREDGSHAVVRSGDLVSPLIYPGCGQGFLRTMPFKGAVSLKGGDVLISSIGLGSIGKISLVVDPTGFFTVSEVTILRDSACFVSLHSPLRPVLRPWVAGIARDRNSTPCSTRQAAAIIGAKLGTLARAVYDGRIPEPARSPSGGFMWSEEDIGRACRTLLGRSLEEILAERAMLEARRP